MNSIIHHINRKKSVRMGVYICMNLFVLNGMNGMGCIKCHTPALNTLNVCVLWYSLSPDTDPVCIDRMLTNEGKKPIRILYCVHVYTQYRCEIINCNLYCDYRVRACMRACLWNSSIWYLAISLPLSWKTQTNRLFSEKLSINHYQHHHNFELYYSVCFFLTHTQIQTLNTGRWVRPRHTIFSIRSNKIGCSSLVYRIKYVNQ